MSDEPKSGGGILTAHISEVPSLPLPKDYMEVIQGEEKILTFIVTASGRFDRAVVDSITVKFRGPTGTVITKTEDGSILRVCQELDVQVIRVTLTPEDTVSLTDGLLHVELAFDLQKAVVTNSLKLIPQLS